MQRAKIVLLNDEIQFKLYRSSIKRLLRSMSFKLNKKKKIKIIMFNYNSMNDW